MKGFEYINRRVKELLGHAHPERIKKLFGRKADGYRTVRVDDLPDAPKPLLLYIAGAAKQEWAAAMLCPCGCEETIHLNLLEQVRPRWTFNENKVGPSLEPSIWRRRGCRSHFFLRNGEIEWCDAPVVRARKTKKRWFQ